MKRRANPLLIGTFVFGALALVVIVIVILGSGLFKREKTYVLYFQGSVMGLNRGSPVVLKGVRVGSVSRIAIRFNPKTLAFFVPVYIDVDPEQLQAYGNHGSNDLSPLVARGLRAQLQTQSYVTGQLVVALDFYPGTTAALARLEKNYPEIPTIPSRVEELSRSLGQLPLKELTQALTDAVKGVNRLVNAPALNQSVESLSDTLAEIRGLTRMIRQEIGPIATSLKETSLAARKAISGVQESLRDAQLKETMVGLRNVMNEAERTLGAARQNLSEGSPVMHDLQAALRDLAGAARSIRVTADYVEQHPEALIRGKRGK